MPQKLLSLKQAAKEAGLHWQTVFRWVRAGKFHPSYEVDLALDTETLIRHRKVIYLFTANDVRELKTLRERAPKRQKGDK